MSLCPSQAQVGRERCELSYRRCTVTMEEMMDMVETEVAEVETIEKEIQSGVISIEDVGNRSVYQLDEL